MVGVLLKVERRGRAVALLGCYAPLIGSYLPTFRDSLMVHLQGSSSPRALNRARIYFVGWNNGWGSPTQLDPTKVLFLISRPKVRFPCCLWNTGERTKSRNQVILRVKILFWSVSVPYNTVFFVCFPCELKKEFVFCKESYKLFKTSLVTALREGGT